MRQRLLATVAASREREHELLAMVDDSPSSEPGVWTVKDHLAHLSAWRTYAARVLDAVRTASAAPVVADDDDVQNAEIYAATKDLSADKVKADARTSYDELEAAIAACSEQDLLKPHPRSPAALVWQVVPGNGHYHLGQHLMFWHLEQGYNLGCFYARVGRADEALHRLKQAFDLDPSLKSVARTDSDLDRIRHQPELVALIGS